MNWYHQFYHRQNELSGVYTGDIEAYHHDRVKLITRQRPVVDPKVLELGAGGGQVACATALAGYDVTMIEYVKGFTDHAQHLMKKHTIENLTVLNGDFYTIELDAKFDVITYWDGFGIGSDDEQIALLKRCASWLNPDGIVLIDVNTPWYWANVRGQTMQFGTAQRRYDFDVSESRMLDTWWDSHTPDDKVTQSLRCYAPADLKLLLRNTGLLFDNIVETGGAVRADGTYEAHVNLDEAMSYVARLTLR